MTLSENWQLYNLICSFGDMLPTDVEISPKKLLEELEPFEDQWKKFNPDKPDIRREGLSLTSADGTFDGLDLHSLKDIYSITGEWYEEMDFRTLTPLYDMSEEVQKLVDPWKDWLGRCHFIRIPPGGYFPTHCDGGRAPARGGDDPEVFRIITPIKKVNPPHFWFMYGGHGRMEAMNFEAGRSYFMNTHKPHALFNTSVNGDSYWLIMNIHVNPDSISKCRYSVYR